MYLTEFLRIINENRDYPNPMPHVIDMGNPLCQKNSIKNPDFHHRLP